MYLVDKVIVYKSFQLINIIGFVIILVLMIYGISSFLERFLLTTYIHPKLALSPIVLIWYGCAEIMRGNLTVGSLVAFNSFIGYLFGPIRNLYNLNLNIQRPFKINPGEIVAIVGKSGVGKTTLVSLILKFFDPTKGRILIDGEDIKERQRIRR